jgi:F-type H+-transporting ATPase subunit gamma
MSGASEALGRRISGAKDLSAVVRSMKVLAASSIAQYEQAVDSLKDYTRAVELGLHVCLRDMGARAHIASKSRPGARGAVIFGSDQGLVGRFNEVLLEFATCTLHSLSGKCTHLWVVGERMQEIVTDTLLSSPKTRPVPNSIDAIAPLVGRILVDIAMAREQDHVDEIYLFHNQPMAAAGYQPVSKRLLPLDALWREDLAALPWPTKTTPEVIGEAESALEVFIREYLFGLLFQACAQSLASEDASRLAAMQRAEDNIAKILEELTRTSHRIRQESIDEELFEVVSGYEALSPIEHRTAEKLRM